MGPPCAFGGPALVVLGAVLAFLALTAVDHRLKTTQGDGDPGQATGIRLAFVIAMGIGLRNLGEGLAIGAASPWLPMWSSNSNDPPRRSGSASFRGVRWLLVVVVV